jgi:hypothetical protein
MKYLLTLCFCFVLTQLKAQNGDIEVNIVAYKYRTVTGHLKKVNAEGIGVEDFKGNYLVFRPGEIKRIKIRKRGLTILEGLGGGTLLGLGIGGGILSLDENGRSTNELLALTAVLTGSGAVIGTLTGSIAQIANTKLTLRINGSENKFRTEFKQLEPYVNNTQVEHLSYRVN